MIEEKLKGLPLGKKCRSRFSRTLSEGDFTMLVNLNWTIGNVHVDQEYMKSTPFGERILPAVCVLSTTIGLANFTGVRDPILERGMKLVAIVGFESVSFSNPIFPGDTFHVESQLLDYRPTSKPNRILARIKDETYKQTGEKVLEDVRLEIYEAEPQPAG